MLSPHGRPVWIGLNPNTPPDQAQATVWVEFRDEKSNVVNVKTIPAIIRPYGAIKNGLTFHTHRLLRKQLQLMGVEATSIEIYGQTTTYTYSMPKYELLCSKKRYAAKTKAATDEVR